MIKESNLTAKPMQVEGSLPPNPAGKGGFAKGQSGNPGGRAKMPPEIREMLSARAQDAVQTITKFLDDADPRVALKAAELLLDRAYGKPQQTSEPISFELPDDTSDAKALVAFHGALLRATASGEVAIADAREMSALFENHRRLHETADLEQRLSNLEKALQNGTA